MKNVLLITFLVPVFILSACIRRTDISKRFSEPADPDSLLYASTWDDSQTGLQASFASTNIRFSRSEVPESGLLSEMVLSGWRGERVSIQLLLWSKSDVPGIRIEASVLRSDNGSIIDTPAIRINPVGYVITDDFLNGCGYRDEDTIPAHLAADLLYENRTFDLPGRTVRPVWFSVDIPENTGAGNYTGKINIFWQDDSLALPLHLNVADLTLPPPEAWSFHLDLWQNPFSIARFHDVPLWSEEHWELIRKYLGMLAGAGQKCITTSIIDHPWHGQTYDPFLPMITWIHNASGRWDYDYSVFDQYVETAMDAGITEQINCYTMVPWGNRFSWYEEDSARTITRTLEPDSREYKDLWQPFLWDFREHLRERGWLANTTIAMDERNHDQMAAQLAFMRETAPEFGITLAGHDYPDLMPQIHDFSYNWRLIGKADPEMLAKRRSNGQKTTFYVACGIHKPNTFTFSPPAEATYLGWVSAAFGFDGFLRWANNSWPSNPMQDSRYIKWPAGDTYLVYPGPRSSIRFEKLREGIQDYEKIKILERIIQSSADIRQKKQGKALMAIFEEIRINPEAENIEQIIADGKKLIDQLGSGE